MKLFKYLRDHRADVLLIVVVAVCAIPNIILSITEQMNPAVRIANILFPIGIYGLLAASTSNVGRMGCWMFILMFFAAFQIVLIYLYGRSVIAVDMFLNLVTTNPDEVGELLGNMLPVIVLVSVLYLPVLTFSIIAIVQKWRTPSYVLRKVRIISIVAVIIGITCGALGSALKGGFQPIGQIYPFNVAENIAIAVQRTAKIEDYHHTSEGMSYHAKTTHPTDKKEIYVIVIGETSRAPQWGLFGGDRRTTAPLDSLSGLVAFPYAVSESNTTHKSVPMLMSSLNAQQFEDSIYSHKSLITAFNEAGYETSYISNQARNHSFIDFFGEEAATTIFVNDSLPLGSHHYDMHLLDVLERLMTKSNATKQLYVLHTYGSHFSYPDRYPKGSQPFMPDYPVEVTGTNNVRLLNAYSNTIHYTAQFLSRLASLLQGQDAVSAFVYTSDHGEDIFDDSRKLFLHASPIPSYHQLHVPFLVWFSQNYLTEDNSKILAAQANKSKRLSSSDAFFHTIMSIAGIATPYAQANRSAVDRELTEKPAIYLNDHNESVALTKCGLQKLDFQEFNKAGIKIGATE